MHHKIVIILSILLIPVIFGIIFMDLGGAFNYSDLPFALAFPAYFVFLFIQKATVKLPMGIALFLLLFMGLSYIPTGPGIITNRIGEWFYLFFLCGVIQSVFAMKKDKSQKDTVA